jgi:hypothetical protein
LRKFLRRDKSAKNPIQNEGNRIKMVNCWPWAVNHPALKLSIGFTVASVFLDASFQAGDFIITGKSPNFTIQTHERKEKFIVSSNTHLTSISAG